MEIRTCGKCRAYSRALLRCIDGKVNPNRKEQRMKRDKNSGSKLNHHKAKVSKITIETFAIDCALRELASRPRHIVDGKLKVGRRVKARDTVRGGS